MGSSKSTATSLEDRSMGNIADTSLAECLRRSTLAAAGLGNTTGGARIASIMHKSRAPNTWRSKQIVWKKWVLFCTADGIDPLSGSESSLLRYLGWLLDDNKVAGGSVRSYLSGVITSHNRLGVPLKLTDRLQLAIDAYQREDSDRKLLANPDGAKERRALPSSIARRIFQLGLSLPDSEIELIRSCTAILTSMVFFERGEAGISLRLTNIRVTPQAIDIAVVLRKNQLRVPHTLSYQRNTAFPDSLIDLALRYDSLRRSLNSTSQYYWALPRLRLTPTARTMNVWLTTVLQRLNLSPPPGVTYSSHSLRMAAGSESAAIGVQEYRILTWGDWKDARTFRDHYMDARIQATVDSYFFFGHLLVSEPRTPSGVLQN